MTDSKTQWTNEELEDIALSIVQEGEKRGIRIRLLGGVGIRLLCKDVIRDHPELNRLCGDIDIAGLSENTSVIEEILQSLCFEPQKEFNFANASSRMLFKKDNLKVDVILDEFRMNHRWSIRERLHKYSLTLSTEDLILTKLQVVKINKKDIIDLITLGFKCFSNSCILSYITEICTVSWGFTHTVQKNLKILIKKNREIVTNNNSYHFISFYKSLLISNDNKKKSIKWKMRSFVGEKLPWYEIVEEP